ncbi:MAG: DUF1700 domain-containing protein [Lachnospiraceae bacterium]|nr:DUF1700 domain-containing protein [Lachnospiraceae bacterium]
MNRTEFLDAISAKLNGLSEEDLKKALSFYKEALDDRIEEGMSEEEAISDIGTPDEIAAEIAAEMPLTKLISAKASTARSLKGWEIALLVIGFPLWGPILLTLVIVVFSVYLSLWSVVLALGAGAVVVILCSLAMLVASFFLIPEVTGPSFVAMLGEGFIVLAVGTLLLIPTALAFWGMVKLGGVIIRGIKRMFVRK